MSNGRWIVRTYRGRGVVEKRTLFQSLGRNRKKKPLHEEERLKKLINENSKNGVLIRVTYTGNETRKEVVKLPVRCH